MATATIAKTKNSAATKAMSMQRAKKGSIWSIPLSNDTYALGHFVLTAKRRHIGLLRVLPERLLALPTMEHYCSMKDRDVERVFLFRVDCDGMEDRGWTLVGIDMQFEDSKWLEIKVVGGRTGGVYQLDSKSLECRWIRMARWGETGLTDGFSSIGYVQGWVDRNIDLKRNNLVTFPELDQFGNLPLAAESVEQKAAFQERFQAWKGEFIKTRLGKAMLRAEEVGAKEFADADDWTHAVRVHLPMASPAELQQCQDIEAKLLDLCLNRGNAEVDGHSIGNGEYVIYIYCRDGKSVASAVRALLRTTLPNVTVSVNWAEL